MTKKPVRIRAASCSAGACHVQTAANSNSDAAIASAGGRAATISLGRSFAVESGNYFLLLGTTIFLVAFGLVMVLSASSQDESHLSWAGLSTTSPSSS